MSQNRQNQLSCSFVLLFFPSLRPYLALFPSPVPILPHLNAVQHPSFLCEVCPQHCPFCTKVNQTGLPFGGSSGSRSPTGPLAWRAQPLSIHHCPALHVFRMGCMSPRCSAHLRSVLLCSPRCLKLSAYVKSSHFLLVPLFLKVAMWDNK